MANQIQRPIIALDRSQTLRRTQQFFRSPSKRSLFKQLLCFTYLIVRNRGGAVARNRVERTQRVRKHCHVFCCRSSLRTRHHRHVTNWHNWAAAIDPPSEHARLAVLRSCLCYPLSPFLSFARSRSISACSRAAVADSADSSELRPFSYRLLTVSSSARMFSIRIW